MSLSADDVPEARVLTIGDQPFFVVDGWARLLMAAHTKTPFRVMFLSTTECRVELANLTDFDNYEIHWQQGRWEKP